MLPVTKGLVVGSLLMVTVMVQGVFAAQRGGSAPSAAPVLATAEGDIPGVRVEIQELKRGSGGTVTLRFAMANESDKKLNFGYNFVAEDSRAKDHGGVGGVHLIDAAGKKKYLVVRDSKKNCVCSRDVHTIAPGSRASLWATFPAPPETVEKITVVIPHFNPIDNAPITR